MEREAIDAESDERAENLDGQGNRQELGDLFGDEAKFMQCQQDPEFPAPPKELMKGSADGSAIDISESVKAAIVDRVSSQDRRVQTARRITDGSAKALEMSFRAYKIDAETTDEDPWKSVISWITQHNQPLVKVGIQVNEPVQRQNEWVK